MELDMWTTSLLAGDWSFNLPVDHSGGLFGDIKSQGYLYGDDSLGLHLQDAVKHVRSESPTKNEDILGTEWMESSDLGSFFEVMGNGHDKLLPLEASLIEYTFSTAPEEPVSFDEHVVKHDSTKRSQNSEEYTSLEEFLSMPLSNQVVDICPQDQYGLSPPSSPDQVAPVIKIEPISTVGASQIGSPNCSHDTSLVDLFGDDAFETTVADQSLIFGGLDFTSVSGSESSVTFDDASELISSPLSADYVESMLSGSTPSSPSSVSRSIIESSPELYKVILTSTIEANKRFSPYTKTKPSKQPKASRTHAPAELVPDDMIREQLSKKDRKKLQNKNAAIRYRMKKKEEAAGIKTEEQILEEQNLELRTKVEDLQREIKYMKNLMEDVCKAKGLTFK
uniref:BZIP domain-containing protein n=1 Tax=Arion vulgaris TaxID=1028688 RepID=A0A0B6Y254_9EUPU